MHPKLLGVPTKTVGRDYGLTAACIFGISLYLGPPFASPPYKPVTAPFPIQPRGEVREP